MPSSVDGRHKAGHDKWTLESMARQANIITATTRPAGSQRQLRVGELVRHALAEMLTRGEVHDPVIEGHLITVPEVRMTPDLRLATIYVMPLGGRDADAGASPRSSATRSTCAARSRTAST